MEVVAVIGASNDRHRYSYQAMELLTQMGHEAVPVHPREEKVLGKPVIHNLMDLVGKKVDTVTVYVNPEISNKYKDALLAVKPKRVIFNPGAENEELGLALTAQGILVENACTLVLLRTGQY